MKKIKKLSAVLLATTMLCLMATTISAAPSPVAESIVSQEVVEATLANGEKANVAITTVEEAEFDDEVLEEIETVKTEETLKEILKDTYTETTKIVDVIDVKFDGELTEPVTITFDVKGVHEGTTVTVLHFNGSEWEVIPCTVGEGTVTATFESLSPIAFAIDKATLRVEEEKPETEVETETETEVEVQPEPAKSNTGLYIGIAVVVIVAIGVVVVVKNKNKEKDEEESK